MAVKKNAEKTAEKQQKRVPGRPFKPGQSGNPAGRPQGALNFATKWRLFMEKAAVENETTADDIERQLLKVALERAREGDIRFWDSIFDRVYGRATQPVEVDGRIDTQEQRVPTEAEIKATRAYEEALIKELKSDNKGEGKKE